MAAKRPKAHGWGRGSGLRRGGKGAAGGRTKHREEKIGQRPQLLSHFRFGFRKGEDKRGGSALGGGAHPSGGPGARALAAPRRPLGPRARSPPSAS